MNKKYQSPLISIDSELYLAGLLAASSDGSLEDMSGEIIFDDLTA
jgi:hypothetical protein